MKLFVSYKVDDVKGIVMRSFSVRWNMFWLNIYLIRYGPLITFAFLSISASLFLYPMWA